MTEVKTVKGALDATLKKRYGKEKRRGYLGMSGIGHKCDRKHWYDFRWASKRNFPASTLRKFDDGHRTEAHLIELLIKSGIEFSPFDEDGCQFEVVNLNGHFRGHLDGLIYDLPYSSGVHVWECKATATSYFKTFEKLVAGDPSTALQKWNETYYVQAQLYMYHMRIAKHLTIVTDAGARDMCEVVTEIDPSVASAHIARADNIIATDAPKKLQRISQSATWYECKMCDHVDVCHYGEEMRWSCRTCRHVEVSPRVEGWRCGLLDKSLTEDQQAKGCKSYREVVDDDYWEV